MVPSPSLTLNRVYGNDAVLSRLERLGRNARTFPNLVAAGFPPGQLSDARVWYAESAASTVEHYASDNMTRGFFEDESLLQLFCRYFDCTDWKLESSPWFFAKEDYERFTKALLEPVTFHTFRLEQKLDQDRWEHHFIQSLFERGLERSRTVLWDSICTQEFYWQPIQSYSHLRAETLFGYLRREYFQSRSDGSALKSDRFNYRWEETFKQRFRPVLEAFERALENALDYWQNQRDEANQRGRRKGSGAVRHPAAPLALGEALVTLGLEGDSFNRADVRKAFRRRSKSAHPDHGGSPDSFRRLKEAKDRLEAWLEG